MSASAPFSELGVRQLQQVFSDFKEADARAKQSVDSTKRVILQVAKHYASSRSTIASAIEQIRRIDGHLRYFVNHFERSHAKAVSQLARFGRDIGEGPISREIYQPFNEYLILRTSASIRGLKLLRVLESALRVMWQSTDARNILVPAFGEHPAQRVGTILQDLNEYLRAVQQHVSSGPYSSAEGVFQSARLYVARRTIGTMPDANFSIDGFDCACTCIRFTQSSAALLEYPFVERIVSDYTLPTGSSCTRGLVLKAQEDLANRALWVVSSISAGGSHVSLVLADTDTPSRLSRTSFLGVHIRDVAIRFLAVSFNGHPLAHADLYRLGMVSLDGGGYVRPGHMYVLASARQRCPGFDERLFRKHGLRGDPYAAPQPSQPELAEIARKQHRLPRRGDAAFPYAGNHFVVTATDQPGVRQTVDIRQGLGNGDTYPIRISTLLENYVLVGPVDLSLCTRGGQLLFFDDADGQLTRITVAPEDNERLNPRDLYQWAGGCSRKKAVGQASTKNVTAWPATSTVAVATHRGLEHERQHVFHRAVETFPGKQQTPAIIAAVKVEEGTLPTGLCLDDLPEIDGRFLDLGEISLGIQVELPWASGDGELDDLLDLHDF